MLCVAKPSLPRQGILRASSLLAQINCRCAPSPTSTETVCRGATFKIAHESYRESNDLPDMFGGDPDLRSQAPFAVSGHVKFSFAARRYAKSNCAAEIPSTLNTLRNAAACKRATAVANRLAHPRHPLQNRCSPILLVYLD
jgi:hypothetical protein